jgi:hypothetical protein
MIMVDIAQYFVKDYEQKEFKELADAPVTAIEGLSEGDAEKLQQAFNFKTVRDLAENKFVRVAQAECLSRAGSYSRAQTRGTKQT